MQLENVNPNDTQLASEALNVLWESNVLLPALIENLPGGAVFVVDRHLRYLLAQGEALSTAGFKPEDFVGRTIFEMLPYELATKYEKSYRQALAGEPFETEHHSHNHWYITRGTPLRSPAGDVYAVLVVSYDITQRKRVEDERQRAEEALRESKERQTFLLTLSDALRSLADPVDIQETVTRTAMNYFGADRCYYCEIEDSNAIIRRDAVRGDLPTVAGVYPLSRFAILQEALDAGRPFVVQDVHTTDTVDENLRQLCIQLQVISYVNVPVIKNGKPVGLLCLLQSIPREWTDLEVKLAVETADLTWAAVERARAEASLRESEEKYRVLFNSIDEGYALLEVIYDAVGKPVDLFYVETNVAFERMNGFCGTGKTLGEILGKLEPFWYETYDRVAKTGEPTRVEYSTELTGAWYSVFCSRVGGAGSNRIAVVFNDITDRKQSEEQLRRTAEMDAFRVKLSDVLRSLSDPIDIQRAAMHIIGEHLAVDRVFYANMMPDGVTTVIHNNYVRDGVPKFIGSFCSTDFGAAAERLRSGKTVVLTDVTTSEDYTEAEKAAYAGIGMNAAIAVPLVKGNRWVANLGIHSIEARCWTDEEIALVQETAERTWAAVERAHAEVALRQSEAKYRSLFDSIDEGYLLCEVIFDENKKPIDIFYLEANPAAVRLAGRDFTGQRMREIDPNYEDYWYEIIGRVALTGESVRAEHYAEPHRRWFDFRASKVGGQESRHVASIFQDTTERKRHDANLAFLAEISQDLARLTSIDETMNALGEKIGRYFNLSACVFAELSETAEIAVIDYTWQLSHMPCFIGTYRMQDFVTPEVLQLCRAGEAVVIRNVFDDPLVDGKQYAALNIGSFLSIPLVRDGEWRFLLVIYHTEPYDWRDDEIELTHELANRIWTRLERARAEEQLRRAAQMDAFRVKLSDALRSLSDAVEIQATVTRTTMNFFGTDRCYYCEIIDGDIIIRRDAAREDLPTVVGVYPLENSPIFRAMLDAGQPFAVEDVHTTDMLGENLRQACFQLQIISFIIVPVIKQGEPVGILSINQTTPRNWTAFEVDLAEEIADRTWATIERTRAEAALREAELQRVREQSAREQERQRAETLAELDRAKTLFFSNISHEFRTPLTLSLAPVQDALSDQVHPLDPVTRERLELVHRNSLRLLKLVNTLLDFSRIEAGRMEAVYEPTDLATYTAELTSVFRSAMERAGLQLIVDCPPLPEPVFVDREMWEKIVLNLLFNALKFTFEGEIRVSLRSLDGNQAVLQIQDTGTGIALEHLPHLFERFYQVRGASARTHEGSGIGLALVHELVRLQGGTIEVSSTLGEGACFTIALPFGTEHLPGDRLQNEGSSQPTRTLASTAMGAAAYVEEAERWATTQDNQEQTIENTEEQTTQTADSSLPTHTSARVLVVDDNADMREYLTRILSDHVQVEAVADGATALTVSQEQVPDLILSDVMMPGLDGFELLGALRADPRTREIPIILLSARAGEEAIVEGLEAGADDYLIKPFSAQELVSRVLAHLQMAHLRGEALQEARSTIRSRDEFISIVSHELNTPLVSILGWTRLLRANSPSPTMLTKALDTIERNAKLQAKLVQDLLDISRITAGKLRLNTEPVELEAVIETAIATVTQMAQTKGIDLNWHKKNMADQDAPNANSIVIMGDRDRLEQVICNLLGNAIKFTPKSGSVTIELSVIDDDHAPNISCAKICVTDTGIGIAADFLTHIFERYRQARDSDAAKGMGLGLAIARHLVELHNGTISAQSAGVGQGATFTVKLPLCLS